MSSENLTISQVLFQEIHFQKSSIFTDSLKYISVMQFSIVNSMIGSSYTLIEINSNNFSFRFIYIKNCFYDINLKLISIRGQVGIIHSLMITDVTDQNERINSDYKQFNDHNYQIYDMIIIYADKISIQQIYFGDLLNPQHLLYIFYNNLQINNIYLRKIYFKTKQQKQQNILKQLIQIYSKNDKSICQIQNFKLTQILIEINSNYQFDVWDNLKILDIFGGNVNFNELMINNILSNVILYIIKADQLQMRIQNTRLNNIQNIGLLYFSSSQVYCIQVFYDTNYLYQIRVPLIKNNQISRNNIITLKDLKFNNLSTPFIDLKSNSSLQILIVNLEVNKIILLDNIIRIDQITNELGLIQISQIYINDQFYDNQQQFYLLSVSNININIEFLQIKNIQMGIYKAINNGGFYAKNLIIQNATINQILFSFNNYSGDISLQKIIIKNLTQQDNPIININYSNQQMIFKPKVVLLNLLINQYIGDSLIQYIQNYQEQSLIALNNIRIEQSYFTNNIFQLKRINQIKLDIQGLQIFKVDCGMFFFTPINILIKKSVIIDLYQREIQGIQEIQFISSNLYQTNILNKEIDLNISQLIYDSYPVQLSFHGNQSFDILKINKIHQIQFSQDSRIAYVPSGQPFLNFRYFNLRTLAHELIYKTFSIIVNSRTLTQNQQILCGFTQSIDGTLIGKYSNYYEFPLKAGLNTFDDFVFIMNPQQNYSFLQNDIICPNYTLRFDVRILPCQLGEYIYQNKCLICDINKNLYSVIKKAQYCSNFNPEQIKEIKVGRIKLNQNYWRPSLTSNFIEKCSIVDVCLGGWMNGDRSCITSRVGALCRECDIYNLKGEGQFALSGQQCLECSPNFLLLLKGFNIFIWIIFITLMNYNTNQKITEKFLQFKIINRTYSDILMRQSIDQFSITIKLYTNYIFIIYLVQENLQFLDNKILLALNFISNPSTIVTTELDYIQYIQLASSLISPIIILMIVFFIYVILLALKFQRYRFNLIIIITYSVYLFNQQIIIQNQIKLLSYKLISGIKWIYSNQQFQFYTSKHIQMMMFFIAPTTSIILLIPILLFFLLRFKDRGSILCIKKYGIIYCDFKQNAYFWEIIRIYTKHVIILLLYFFNQVDQSILILFLLVKTYLHEYLQPYPLNNINKLENYAYRLTAFQLIVIFQLIKQLPTLSYTILTILNIGFGYRIILLLIRCFKRQYRNLIQKIIQWLRQKFPNRFQRLEQQNNQFMNNLQKFRRAVHKKIQNRSSSIRQNIQQSMPEVRENLITINSEIELQPLQNRPYAQDNQMEQIQ